MYSIEYLATGDEIMRTCELRQAKNTNENELNTQIEQTQTIPGKIEFN